MPVLNVHGIKIHYRWVGKTSGKQLVFVHGWAASSEWWIRQIPALSTEYRLLMVDLPGHGRSSCLPKHSSLNMLSAVLDSVINMLGVEDPVLVGWSLGGMVSLQYALDHPNNLSALILVDTSPTARAMPSFGFLPTIPYHWIPDPRRFLPLVKSHTLFLEGLLSFINKLNSSRRGVAALLVHLLATGKKPDKNLVSWCTQVLLKDLNIKALLQIMVAMVKFDVINRLAEITAPTLIIHGSDDRMLPVDLSLLLHQNIKNSNLQVIEDAGHCPHLEKPREFNKTIIGFLNRLDTISVFKPQLVFSTTSAS